MKKFVELLFYVTFGAGMAFGTSSFTMMSELFQVVNSLWVVAAIWAAGLFCILISSSIAELASMYPSAPGVRTYLKVALQERVSLLLVYLYLIFMVLVAGIESYLFALVVKAILPKVYPMAVVLGLLAFTVVINLLGLELPRGMQMLTTTLLIGTVVVLGIYGVAAAPVEARQPLRLEFSREQLRLLPAATGIAVYLFVGFEWVTMLGFRPKSYEWKIPLSMPLAICTNLISYSTFALGLAACLSTRTVTSSSVPQIPYFVAILGPLGTYVALGLSMLAIIGTFNAGIMGGSRLVHALATEGTVPKSWGTLSLRTGSPVGGICVLATLATVASVFVVRFELEKLAAVVGSAIVCFVYAAFVLAVIRLRKSQPNLRRTYRTPVPLWMQWLIVGIMPVMGVLSLFSERETTLQAVGTAGFLVLVAAAGVQWSLRRTRRLVGLGT